MPQDPALEVFELWGTSPPLGDADLSFAAAGATSDVPLWSVDLGPGADGARQRLSALESEVQQAGQQLNRVPDRLDQLLLLTAPRPQGVVSFSGSSSGSLSAAAALSDPERDLLLWAGHSEGGGGEVSFAATATVDLGRARDQLAAALRRLSQMFTHMAWVETRAGGRLLGRTTVGWTGKTRTVRTAGLAPWRGALHQRNVSLAVASRLALLRTLVMVQQGAMKISMLLTLSGGAATVAALPLAWIYVRRVLAEIKG